MRWQVGLIGACREAVISVDTCVTARHVVTCTELSCKKEKNLMCRVERNQTQSLKDANPWKGVMPKNVASSKLYLKLHLRGMLQKLLKTHMLSHLLKNTRNNRPDTYNLVFV